MNRIFNRLFPICMLCLVTACGGNPSLVDHALQATGLRKPTPSIDAQALSPPARKVALHLHAAPRLNLDAHGQPLALLVRVYLLRQRAAFAQAPYAAFLSPQSERETLGADLVDVRELTLVPDQHLDLDLDLDQSVAREAGYVGVVALFHAPAVQGWRLNFAAADAERAGITLGLHACSLSVGLGAAASGDAPPPLSLVHCQ